MANVLSRDDNFLPAVGGVSSLTNTAVKPFRYNPTTRGLEVHLVGDDAGLGIGNYDYVSLSQASTTDTYTFKTGGSGGTVVAVVTITYTDSGKGTLSTVAIT